MSRPLPTAIGSLGFVVLTAWSAAGCGSASSPTGSTPDEGSWAGEAVSFRVNAGRLVDWQVDGIGCEHGSELPQERCSSPAFVPAESEVVLEGTEFVATLGQLAIQGRFETQTRVSGTWTWFGSPCCTGTGEWSATVSDGAGGVDADDGTGSGGATGSEGSDGVDVTAGAVPDDATDAQRAAIARVNWYRARVGAPVMDMDATVNAAAQAHADYYALHAAAYASGAVPGGSHAQSRDLSEGFTGVGFADRMKAAGYGGNPGFEVIAFLGSPEAAVDAWMETVYHRIPLVSPEATDAGYGGVTSGKGRIDVMDFGIAPHADKSLEVVYPWAGQTGVPRSWDGNEGPQPTPPPGGYPSGPVITLTTPSSVSLTIETHVLTDGSGSAIPHVWLPKGTNAFLSETWALYAHSPLQGDMTYTVLLEGARAGTPWRREWTFTTAP